MRSFTEELISRVSTAASTALVRIGAVPDYSVEKQDYNDEPLLSRLLSLVVPPAFLALIDHPGQCFFAPDPDVPFALLRLICAELTASSIPTPVKCKVLDPQETSVPASPSFAPSSPCTSFVASTPATTSTSPASETPASSVHASPCLSPASLVSEIVETGEQELEDAMFRGLLAKSDEAKDLPHTTSSSASCAAPVAPASSPVNVSLTTSMADLADMFAALELDEAKNLPHTTSSSAPCAAPVAPASSPVNASLTTSMADLSGMFAALELAPAEAKSTPVEPVDKVLNERKEEKVKKVRFATKLSTTTRDQPTASGSAVENVDKEIKHKEKHDKKSAKRDAKRAENGSNQITDELKEKKDKKEARRASKLATNTHDQPTASGSAVENVDKEIKHKEKHDKKSAKRDAKRAEHGGNQITDELKEKNDKKEARLATKLATNTHDQPTASGSAVENVDKEIKHKEKLDKKSAKRDAKRAENGGNQILDESKEKKDKKEARLATKLASNSRDQPTASGSAVENVDKEIKHKEKHAKRKARLDAKRAERGGNQPDFFSSGSGSTNKEKPPTPSTSSTNFFAGLASGIGSTNKEQIPTPSTSSTTSSAPEPTLPAFTFGSSSVTHTAATLHHIPTTNSSIVIGGRAFQLPPLPTTTLPPLAISTPATPAGGLFSSSTSTGDNKEAFTFGTSASSSSFDFDCRVVKPLRRSRK
ncbi:hypothetical protein JCM5296_006891 [Sporobolomyces johnsonii]